MINRRRPGKIELQSIQDVTLRIGQNWAELRMFVNQNTRRCQIRWDKSTKTKERFLTRVRKKTLKHLKNLPLGKIVRDLQDKIYLKTPVHRLQHDPAHIQIEYRTLGIKAISLRIIKHRFDSLLSGRLNLIAPKRRQNRSTT